MKKIFQAPLFLSVVFLLTSCIAPNIEVPDDPMEYLSLPPGFKAEIYADNILNARAMALSPNGILYVGSRSAGNVYAVIDDNGNNRADRIITIADGLLMPVGVAWKDGDLYVSAVSKILRFDDIDNHLEAVPEPVIITGDYPTNRAHGWKYIAFGPDGYLYVPVGAPCNICNRDEEIYSTITRIKPDGSDREIVAHGVRNTVGFDWHPETGELWFTDNGRDWMGDDLPPDELNRLETVGQHFGYPFVHGNNIIDPEYGVAGEVTGLDFTPPVQELGPHVAALGMLFYTGDMFPEEYKNQILIAEHGSWNRSSKIGYRVSLVRLDGNNATSYEPFADGWLQQPGEQVLGRPVDIIQMPDGSILVSDDHLNKIYRITYDS
jgi:glucose/arabinose dehydrogenase